MNKEIYEGMKKYFYQGFKEPVYLEKVETTNYDEFRIYYLIYRGEKIYATCNFSNRLPYQTNIKNLRADIEREMIEVDRKLDRPIDYEERYADEAFKMFFDFLEEGEE